MGETKEVGGGGSILLDDGRGENGRMSSEFIPSRVSADMSGRAWYADERRGRFNGDDSLADENDIRG